MKIAWIGPYDINSIVHRMDQPFAAPFHPATWVRNAGRALVRHSDAELHLLMHDKRFAKDWRFTEDGIHFHLFHTPVPQIPRPLALYQLDRWKYMNELKLIRPDIVHGHGTENLYSYIAITSGFPAVISIQAIISELFRQYRRMSRQYFEHFVVQFIERHTIRRASHVILKAPFAEPFVRKYNPTVKTHLLENIVHESYFQATRDPGKKVKNIVFVGTLTNTKGVEELIQAFHRLAAEFEEIELHLVGNGTDTYVKTVLKPLIQNGAGKGRIILRGVLSAVQIVELFSETLMSVLPSYFDTSPNVVAEAQVAGVPVIGTNVGGIPFMISKDDTGLIVPVRDVDALTDAMRSYLNHPEIASRHAALGQERARQRFGEERFVKSLLQIYAEVVPNVAPPSWKEY